jgi:carboxyvinyl-carboxyphosphonate phosphorylmutase
MTPTEKRNRLRAILQGDVCKSPATVWDALSARVAEAAGFECGLLSGSVSAATLLGAPDLALQTLTEFADQIRHITRAADLSVFADADQGYGNALNAMRTVEELEHAGLAGLAIEDLVMPAHFGRRGAPELIGVPEAIGKLEAALSARRDASLVIVARTAALRVEPIARVVERARAYAATGVDGLFLSGLKQLDHLDAIRAAVDIPIILGSAPGISRAEAQARGVRFRLQGHAVLAVCARAMYETYMHFKADGRPEDLKTASAEEMARLLKAADYQAWDDAYLNQRADR